MNKKFSIATLLLLLFPLCIEPSSKSVKFAAKGKELSPEKKHQYICEALELANSIRNPLDRAFGSLGAEEADEDTQAPLDEFITVLEKSIAKTTNKEFNPVNKHINTLIKNLFEKEKNKNLFRQEMNALYALVTSKITQPLQKGKKGAIYLKLNEKSKIWSYLHKKTDKEKSKIQTEITRDIINLMAVLWIKYIEVFDNEPVTILINPEAGKNRTLTPLKWAYYTAHAGARKFNYENNVIGHYSKPYIQTLLAMTKELAGKTNGVILGQVKKGNLNKEEIKKLTYQELEKCYKALMQPKQKQSNYLKLKAEYQDAFPAKKTRTVFAYYYELPQEMETALTSVSSVWLTLKKHDIIPAEESITLTYPKIIGATPEETVELSIGDWTKYTAEAGYDHKTKNGSFAKLLKEGSGDSWFAHFSENIKDKFTDLRHWIEGKDDIDVDDADIDDSDL